MFKSSVQWKIVTMFLLIVLAIMMVFGMIMKEQISAFYLNRFKNEITLAFSEELTAQLDRAALQNNAQFDLENILNRFRELMQKFIGG